LFIGEEASETVCRTRWQSTQEKERKDRGSGKKLHTCKKKQKRKKRQITKHYGRRRGVSPARKVKQREREVGPPGHRETSPREKRPKK